MPRTPHLFYLLELPPQQAVGAVVVRHERLELHDFAAPLPRLLLCLRGWESGVRTGGSARTGQQANSHLEKAA
eukprot:365291-Chlamydomonas_euryale.AAC.9